MRGVPARLAGWALTAAGALAGSATPAQAAGAPTPTTDAATATAEANTWDYALRPQTIAPGHWVIAGAVDDFRRSNGCNIINTAFVLVDGGVVVINTGPSLRYGRQQRRAMQAVLPAGTGPVLRVLNLNLHPDYFFGNQAWLDRPIQALAGSQAGMLAEGPAYADNLYRLCGDWMAGTEPAAASEVLDLAAQALRGSSLELHRLQGHTSDDLVVLDRVARVAYVGGLVFKDRVPTTPHAHLASWLASLDTLAQWLSDGEGMPWVVVPSHGPVHTGLEGLKQTRDWLQWLHTVLQDSAERGLDLGELLHTVQIPQRFARWAAQPVELHRTFTQWYPHYERRALER
jgi:quinoprotein relay system zinc metallohydrolase 1